MKLIKKLKPFLGNLPRHRSGRNIGRIDREAVADIYGFSIKELTKAYLNWQDIFRIGGSNLTYKEYLDMLVATGISPSDVGNKKDQFNLSRYGDVGPYTNTTCRFISRLENMKEQKTLFGRPNRME